MDFNVAGLIELLSNLFLIYLFIGLGIIWRFSKFYKEEYGRWFTQIVFWIFFPISIISSFAKIESFVGEVIIIITLIALAVHGVSFFSAYLFARNYPSDETGSLVMCGTFPNTLLFPFPIILAVLGSTENGILALFYATIFVFVAMVLRNSLGLFLGMKYQPRKEETDTSPQREFLKAFVDLLKFPPFLAIFAGFLLHGLFGSQAIGAIPGLEIVKNISLYGALLLVGISFKDLAQLHPRNYVSKDVIQVGVVRFMIGPLVAIMLIVMLPVSALMAVPILIQSMAPPAVSNIIYGKFFNFDTSQISLLVTVLTFLALILLPFELIAIQILFPISN